MRKLRLQMQVSLDLYISAKKQGMSWMIWPYSGPWTWDEELRDYFTAVTAANDTILLGWDMADGGYIDHWTRIFIVNPAILGSGLSIFTGMDDILRLTPVSARAYPCGITVLVYKPQ